MAVKLFNLSERVKKLTDKLSVIFSVYKIEGSMIRCFPNIGDKTMMNFKETFHFIDVLRKTGTNLGALF